MILRREV